MIIVLLAGANSLHSTRLANQLSLNGNTVHLISLHPLEHRLEDRVKFYYIKSILPFGYLYTFLQVKKLIYTINPDILNSHYATGYGLLSRLVSFKPTLLSVWGSDIYIYPKKSFFHKFLVKGNLKNATAIASTSNCMISEMRKVYDHPHIFCTPFGINELTFQPRKILDNHNSFVIGTVKSLEKIYGIDILIKSFHLAWLSLGKPDNLLLEISGHGSQQNALSQLVFDLGLNNNVIFHGYISQDQLPDIFNRMDIFCALSLSESFGVSILEASACQIPVIVSDADGLKEVTIHNKTGIVVPRNSPQLTSDAIITLFKNNKLRLEMGYNGRQYVLNNFTNDKTIKLMNDALNQTRNIC